MRLGLGWGGWGWAGEACARVHEACVHVILRELQPKKQKKSERKTIWSNEWERIGHGGCVVDDQQSVGTLWMTNKV